jgi:hypothetical protein
MDGRSALSIVILVANNESHAIACQKQSATIINDSGRQQPNSERKYFHCVLCYLALLFALKFIY